MTKARRKGRTSSSGGEEKSDELDAVGSGRDVDGESGEAEELVEEDEAEALKDPVGPGKSGQRRCECRDVGDSPVRGCDDPDASEEVDGDGEELDLG